MMPIALRVVDVKGLQKVKKPHFGYVSILIWITFLFFLPSACTPVKGGRPAPHTKKERLARVPPKKIHKPSKVRTLPRKGESVKIPPETVKPHGTPDPRMIASLNLTSQGERCIREGRYDEAINILERSVSLHSANGRSYFFLAEAWLNKGNASQAREFNRLAGRYLKDDGNFSKRIMNQKKKIETYGATKN